MVDLKNYITVITTTTYNKKSPSTEIIEESINSFIDRTGFSDFRHLIYYDKYRDSKLMDKYQENLENLKDKYKNVEVYTCKDVHGLGGGFIYLFNKVKTPYIIFIEHDWLFLKDIDLETVINVMEKYNYVNYIRFNKRKTVHTNLDNKLEEEDRIKELPLTRVWNFFGNPFIARTSFIKEMCLRHFKENAGKRGLGGEITPLIQNDAKEIGWEESHKKWGTYIYGEKGHEKMIWHIDGRREVPKQ
jgi:hypothetical protein